MKTVSLKTSIPGPRSQAVRVREDEHLAPGLQGFALMAGIAVDHAQGSTVTDVDGNRFIDIIGGIGVNGLGHSHPKWTAALTDQLAKSSVGSFTTEVRAKLFDKLAEHRPAPDVHRTQLYSSGAEAVESALRLAKCATGKHEMVSFSGGFHGKTLGALGLMGSDFKNGLGPFAPGNHIIPYANCYRCPLKLKNPSCGLACVEVGRAQIKSQSEGKVAAFIVEPMQGTAGNVIPPKEFLPAIKSVAQEFGALFIADEMITGFGRTGTFWGTEHSGIKPDIVTLGKQFGGGFPMSAVMANEKVIHAKPWSNTSGSSSSYGGNPLASRSALTAIEIIEQEGLVERSKRLGAMFLEKLLGFNDRYPFVGDVRGKGLFLSIEFVKDKQTKEPLSKAACAEIFKGALKRGLLTMAYAPSFRIQPAMTIEEQVLDESVEILRETLDEIKASGAYKMS